MTQDINTSEILVISESTVLDGNGHTLTSTARRAINVENTEALSVTIKNLSIESTGERAINIINGSHNVTIDKVVATTKNYAVMVATSAPNVKLSISDSNLTGMNVVNIAGKKTECQITNTDLTCIDNSEPEGYAAIAIYNTGIESEVQMDGGSISVSGEHNDSLAGSISADAASITLNDVQGEDLEIEYDNYFIAYANQTAYSFSTFEAALEYAKDGETICLSTDVELSETYSITKNITINLNGYDLDASENTSRPFNVEDGKLTIEGGESNIKVGKYGLVNIPAGKNAEVILNGGIYEGKTDNGSFLKPRGEGEISFTMTGVKYTDSSEDGYIMDASDYDGSDITMVLEKCNFAAAGGLISVVGSVSIKETEIETSGEDYVFASVEFSGNGTGNIESSTIKSTSSKGIAVSAGFGATMTVNNCSVVGQKFAYCVYQTGGTINVTAGSYEGPVGVYEELFDNAYSDAKIT